MVRRSLIPMVAAAQRLPWHASLPEGLHGETLDRLIAWCRARLVPEGWYYPIPGGHFAFARRETAEAFAAETARLFGTAAPLRDARVTQAPPWVGKPR